MKHPAFSCDVCVEGGEALERAVQGYDLIIVDWEMPDMNGKQFLREAKARGIHPNKMVINSSHDAQTLHEHFEIDECLAVLCKVDPSQQEVLAMMLQDLLER